MPAACAIEMVHTYSLIHDDLPAMDDDRLRRGRPTCHIKFGEAQAILAGDALLTLAFEIVARDVHPPATPPPPAVPIWPTRPARSGWSAGKWPTSQAEDDGSRRASNELEAIHRRKTGRLLCVGPHHGRADRAEPSPEALASLDRYGDKVGLAFQIVDDLLDIVGEQAKMGKGVRKDASHGKLTYPALLGMRGKP